MSRNDPNRHRVKQELFNMYGSFCMLCGRKFVRKELQLHHIIKWEHSHKTTMEDSSLVCANCHRRINIAERKCKNEYQELNKQIRSYKAKIGE